MTKWDGGINQRSYLLAIQPSGQIAFGVNNDGGDDSADIGNVFSLGTVPINQWTHAAGVYDGASLKLYLNGVLQDTTPWTQGIFPGSAPLSIGSALTSGSFFNGLIDEPAIYNRALSAAEIQAIYNAGSAGKCMPIVQAVDRLLAQVESSWPRSRPLIATLSAALDSIDRGNSVSAVKQLLAFQNKVRSQVVPSDPALAASFIEAAQQVIDALQGSP